MSTEWITDRLPTINDCYGTCCCVWVTWGDGEVGPRTWFHVEKKQPWQQFVKPAPYVKPKRWTVARIEGSVGFYLLKQGIYWQSLPSTLSREAAERIADIYNEELP